MPEYKLTYFDLRGWGEPIRQLFHIAHVPYEDIRIPMTDSKTWPEMKDKTPFGKLPVLSVDGFEIPQSAAICRYLAKKFGFAGKTPEDEAMVDAIVDLFKDFCEPYKELIFAARAGVLAEEVLRIRYEVFNPARDIYFNVLTKILEKNKSGYLVSDELTWADLVVADNLHSLEKLNALDELDGHERLREYKRKIYSTPDLEDHIATRNDTEI